MDAAVVQGEIVAYKSLKDTTLRITIDLQSESETARFHESFAVGALVAIARLTDDPS